MMCLLPYHPTVEMLDFCMQDLILRETDLLLEIIKETFIFLISPTTGNYFKAVARSLWISKICTARMSALKKWMLIGKLWHMETWMKFEFANFYWNLTYFGPKRYPIRVLCSSEFVYNYDTGHFFGFLHYNSKFCVH